MDRNFADLECKSTIYVTPDQLTDPVRNYFGGRIPLDPATEPGNPTKAEAYGSDPLRADRIEGLLDPNNHGDGLLIPWTDFDGVFVNPPYGKVLKDWCKKIYAETTSGATVLALLPCGARFGTRYFQDYIFSPGLDAACFIRGRVRFLRPDGSKTEGQNPYDSVIYGFNVNVDRFVACFKHLGATLRIEVAD